MALTPSTMRLEPGSDAPQFSLPDVRTGKKVSLRDVAGGKGLLVMFLCRHCPYVVHVQKELARLGKDYAGKLGLVAVCSNDAERYPDDAPDRLKEQAEEQGFTFPYLHDPDQGAAKAYSAACTPDFFLFDSRLKLAYRGQLDDSRPGNGVPVTGKDLRAALDAVLAGKPAPAKQKPSLGCNIKWRAGNEPEYFR